MDVGPPSSRRTSSQTLHFITSAKTLLPNKEGPVLRSRCPRAALPPEAPGEGPSRLFQVLGAPGVPGLGSWPHPSHLQICRTFKCLSVLSSFLLFPCVCANLFLPPSHKDPCNDIGPPWILENHFPISRALVTLAESFLQNKGL